MPPARCQPVSVALCLCEKKKELANKGRLEATQRDHGSAMP